MLYTLIFLILPLLLGFTTTLNVWVAGMICAATLQAMFWFIPSEWRCNVEKQKIIPARQNGKFVSHVVVNMIVFPFFVLSIFSTLLASISRYAL